MVTLKELLETAFKAGINAGIIEAGHQIGLMQNNKEQTFAQFCEIPFIKSTLENYDIRNSKRT